MFLTNEEGVMAISATLSSYKGTVICKIRPQYEDRLQCPRNFNICCAICCTDYRKECKKNEAVNQPCLDNDRLKTNLCRGHTEYLWRKKHRLYSLY